MRKTYTDDQFFHFSLDQMDMWEKPRDQPERYRQFKRESIDANEVKLMYI